MILIPAAGEGRRFREAGYEGPKHLLSLGGVQMIDRVLQNCLSVMPGSDAQVLTQETVGKTRGALETVSRAVVPDAEELLVANCDQLVSFPTDLWKRRHGVVFTFPSANPAHSYVQTGGNDRIIEIREKEVISGRAVAGVYWFHRSDFFLEACRRIVDSAQEGELYVSRALQHLIETGHYLYAVDAPTAILGTPEDFQRFEVALSLCS